VVPDFKQHLRRQLGFLQRSCESYDAGHTDESIRIAIVIRVLIYDTKNSTSLLKHLRATNVTLASTVPVGVPHPNAVMFNGMGRLTISGGPPPNATWKASTGSDSIRARLPVPEWWNQIVFILGKTRCSRKDLVLAAANRDGGAHVDATLTADYATLMTTGMRGFFHYSPTGEAGTFEPIMDAHLVLHPTNGSRDFEQPGLAGADCSTHAYARRTTALPEIIWSTSAARPLLFP
jgi:hypothetical protein